MKKNNYAQPSSRVVKMRSQFLLTGSDSGSIGLGGGGNGKADPNSGMMAKERPSSID